MPACRRSATAAVRRRPCTTRVPTDSRHNSHPPVRTLVFRRRLTLYISVTGLRRRCTINDRRLRPGRTPARRSRRRRRRRRLLRRVPVALRSRYSRVTVTLQSGSRAHVTEMTGKNRPDKALTLKLNTGRNSEFADDVVSTPALGRRATLATSTPGSESRTKPSLLGWFKPKRRTSAATPESRDVSSRTSEPDATYPDKGGAFEWTAHLPPEQLAAKLAKEAMAKTVAWSTKTGLCAASTHKAHGPNQEPKRGTSPATAKHGSEDDGSDSGLSTIPRSECLNIMWDGHHQQQQQQHHHHYHHDHDHQRWHSSGNLSLTGRSTSPCPPPTSSLDPDAFAPNVYHHHHHHHHYYNHYYHFRGRPVQERPVSFPGSLSHTGSTSEEIGEYQQSENNVNNLNFSDLKYTLENRKTPRSIHRKVKNFLFKKPAINVKKNQNCRLSFNEKEDSNNKELKNTLDNNSGQNIDENKPIHDENAHKNVMLELERTEKEYVTDLSQVFEGYKVVMEDPKAANCSISVPEDLKINSEKFKLIFISIKPIYEWHKDVCLPALERCLVEPHEFNELLQQFDMLLKMYADYCQKIHNFKLLVNEYENYFEEIRKFLRYDLPIFSIMIKPLQRIMMYTNMLKKMFECVKQGKLKIDIVMLQKSINDLNKFIQNNKEIKIANQLQECNTINSPTVMNSAQNIVEDACEKALLNLDCVMNELISTEKQYVDDLGHVVNGYMEVMDNPKAAGCEIPIPSEFESNTCMQKLVFVNIKQIYKKHKDEILPILERSLNQYQNLQNFTKKLQSCKHLYATYYQKKSISESLVTMHNNYFEDVRLFLNHKFRISLFMIAPVKRLPNYVLLLTQMLKFAKQAGLHEQMKEIQNAIQTISNLTMELNEITIVDQLCHFDGEIRNQGDLLLHETLRCAETYNAVNPIKISYKNLHVFLFDKIMIFTVEVTNKPHEKLPQYYYKDHILLNRMELENPCNPVDGSFYIRSTDSSRSPMRRYHCRPTKLESPSKWFDKLQSIIDAQNSFEERLAYPQGK